MKRLIAVTVAASFMMLASPQQAGAGDPFAAGDDALAVKASDGSSSVRARLKLKKMGPDIVLVRVKGVDDRKWPNCVFSGLVLRPAKSKAKHFKLLGRGKVYKFRPVLKMKGRTANFGDKMTRNNLGACYYPKKTKLEVKVSGVDLKAKVFLASEVYLK